MSGTELLAVVLIGVLALLIQALILHVIKDVRILRQKRSNQNEEKNA